MTVFAYYTPVHFFVGPYVVNGTEGSDYISVSYSNHPLLGPRATIRVNPTFTNPGVIALLQPAQGIQINGLGGNDVIQYSGSMGSSIYAGEGNDTVTAGSGGDYISGDGGNDILNGGLGGDVFAGGAGGADTVDYSARTAQVRATTDGTANDGEAGEADNVMGDIEVLVGGWGNDYLNFFSGPAGWHKLVGNAGNDTLIGSNGPDLMEDGAGDDSLKGNYGDDMLLATSGNDILRGEYGRDLLTGGTENDVLYGDGNWDTLWGDEGNDTMYGGYAEDTMNGGSGNDVMYGDEGGDLIRGDGDNDRLYGGQDSDNMDGGAGNDGLFGGFGIYGGTDQLTGGTGHDRFLHMSPDVINDLGSTDARINFVNGGVTTVTFTGQNGSYTFAAGNWTDSHVQTLDTALHTLHMATGNTRLLKKANRGELKFVRQGPGTSSTGGTFSAAAWNGDGVISVVSLSIGTILHEIGHNWDTEFDATNWNALSGWTQADMSMNTMYTAGTGNDGWWRLSSAQFTSTYAQTNPYEDFAEHFEVNMMNRAGLGAGLTVVAAKNSFIDNMLNSLAANP
jgi:Ca2+-binding RTX toxin-like protein